jgi:hypothetical protein
MLACKRGLLIAPRRSILSEGLSDADCPARQDFDEPLRASLLRRAEGAGDIGLDEMGGPPGHARPPVAATLSHNAPRSTVIVVIGRFVGSKPRALRNAACLAVVFSRTPLRTASIVLPPPG